MIDELYSREILRRTTQLQHVGHLAHPDAVADKVAKLLRQHYPCRNMPGRWYHQ